MLKWQPFLVEGQTENVCTLYLPLSEGVITPRYNLLGLMLIRDALARNPLLFCLGMGGSQRDLPKTLQLMGWQVHDVPFFFLPLRARPFLTNLQPVQKKRWLGLAADIASLSGAASLGLALIYSWRRPSAEIRRHTRQELVTRFGEWADDLWSRSKADYSLCAVRQSDTQNRLYASQAGENRRVLVRHRDREVGWFIARARPMQGHKYFGNMCVGSVIDALAEPGYETHILWAARSHLIGCKADIIVCNIQHESWCQALRQAGFFSGPSNFALAASPKLSARLSPYATRINRAQFMRGDGEGPTHL